MRVLRALPLTLLFACSFGRTESPIPDDSRILLLAVPENWNAQEATLQAFHRESPTAPWKSITPSYPVNLGKNGLAWGRGLHPSQSGPQKREGDAKSPAGVFLLGSILYGLETNNPLPAWRYRRVTERDLWIEDPKSPGYNRHLILGPGDLFPENHLFERMRQNDPAHALKIFIRHNAPPDVQPGAGSAIFFHLARGSDHPTTGCTTLFRENFETLFAYFSPKEVPVYVLVPRAEYDRLKPSWKLP